MNIQAASSVEEKNFLHFYMKGLNKVIKVIDGNNNYDEVLGYRLQKAEYIESMDSDGLLNFESASKIYWTKIINCKPTVYDVDPNCKVIGYGSTRNNKREFDFLSRWLDRHGYKVEIKNIASMESYKFDGCLQNIFEALLFSLDIFLKRRVRFRRSVLHQAINYTIAYVTAILSLSSTRANLFVVANDHSPIPVAFSMAARLNGITNIYVQHAEVNNNFPNLDYDFSVLRNKISSDIYKGIGDVSGDYVYVDRDESNVSLEEINRNNSRLRDVQEPHVVIYPSSVINEESLHNLINKIKRNKSIKSLKIKPHPASRDMIYLKSLGLEVLSSIPDYLHYAICGNSAVVIELLSKGNIVYQYFDMDNIGQDYYGFVRNEIAYNLNNNDLEGEGWASNLNTYSTIREDNLGLYLPGVDSQRNALEKEKYGYFIHKLMYSCGNEEFDIQHWHSYIFRRDLFFFTKSLLTSFRVMTRFKEKWVVKELDSIFNNRDARLDSLYTADGIEDCLSIIDFWLLIKRIEWTGYCPPDIIISNLIKYSRSIISDVKVKSWAESKIFDVICRHGEACEMDSYLDGCQEFSLKSSSISKQISFIKYIKKNTKEREFLLKYLEEGGVIRTELDELKLKIQTYDPNVDADDGRIKFYYVEDKYLSSVKSNLAEEYKKYVVSTYNKLGGRACFMDVKFSETQRKMLVEKIKKALVGKQGFSLIRLGDGEGYLFQKEFNLFTLNDADNRERHWWGQQIPHNIKERLIRDTVISIENCDVIGIPSIYRFLRDTNNRTKSLLNTIQGRGLFSVLLGIKELDREGIYYTDCSVNLAIFNKIDIIHELAKHSNKVVVVSSGREESVRSVFDKISNTVHIPVPTHYKTKQNSSYFTSSTPLPYIYDEIKSKLETVVEPGDLVLVGAGLAGKVFVNAAKACNAVGIDVGSAMDEYVGGGIHSLH